MKFDGDFKTTTMMIITMREIERENTKNRFNCSFHTVYPNQQSVNYNMMNPLHLPTAPQHHPHAAQPQHFYQVIRVNWYESVGRTKE